MFLNLSIDYWKTHMKRFFTIATVTILGAVAISVVLLFIRSNKQIILEKELDLLGNYDAAFYEIDNSDLSLITQSESVNESGFYRELGYAGEHGNPKYKMVSFPDKKSVDIYNEVCEKGRYPENDTEIAIDINMAKELGIIPKPGIKLKLYLYDNEKKEIDSREYTVSGIFEASSADVYGGFYRYPLSVENYDVPQVVLFDSKDYESTNVPISVFVQIDGNNGEAVGDILKKGFKRIYGCDVRGGRTVAASIILGINDHMDSEYGELSTERLISEMGEGKVWKDFYSSVVVPLFSFLIVSIVILSVINMLRDTLSDRSRFMGILRGLGLSRDKLFIYLFIETLFIVIGMTLVGIGIGIGIHSAIVEIICKVEDSIFPSGLFVSEYVKSVTYSPIIFTFVLMVLSGIVSVVPLLIRFVKLSPIMTIKGNALNPGNGTDQARGERGCFFSCKDPSWQRVLRKKIRFVDTTIYIISCLVMSVCFLGYSYYKSLSDLNNSEYTFELAENGLEKWDYIASKSDSMGVYEFKIENHHESGVSVDKFQEFLNKNNISKSFARIVNNSTRLVYGKGANTLPESLNLRNHNPSEDEYENALYEAQEAMVRESGYSIDEEIYTLPTVGVQESEFDDLNGYVVEGTINPMKITSGEELVLIVPKEYEKDILGQMHAGDTLPMSDIILEGDEELLDFNSINPFDHKKPSYVKMVRDPESGEEVRLASFSFGKRKNINTKIGAVVVLDDDELLEKFAVKAVTGGQLYDTTSDEDITTYTLTALCLPDSFEIWGLPDHLFTDVRVKCDENEDMERVTEEWYKLIGSCNNISYLSSYEIKQTMNTNEKDIMLICVLMIIMLITVGIVNISIKLYSNIKFKNKSIARIRALGAPTIWIEGIIIRQSAICMVAGIVFTLIPVLLCQLFFEYIKWKVDSGAWVGIETGGIPWYHNIPFRHSLFDHNPLLVLIILIGVFWVLFFISTIPPLHFIKKQHIADVLDSENY